MRLEPSAEGDVALLTNVAKHPSCLLEANPIKKTLDNEAAVLLYLVMPVLTDKGRLSRVLSIARAPQLVSRIAESGCWAFFVRFHFYFFEAALAVRDVQEIRRRGAVRNKGDI